MIGFRIYGTKERRAGFTPLVTAGVLAGDEGNNMYRSTLVNEKPSFVLKHAQDYILYLLIDHRVKAFDTDASGMLTIALTIPSDKKLAGGKSPYQILRDAYETFLNLYTVKVSDDRNEFKNVDYDQNLFRDMLSGYSLEPRLTPPYVRMSASGLAGVLCVPAEDLNDFFKNTQYPEFAQFKEIQIGSHCSSQVSPGLNNLKIPMPPVQYRIRVNGTDTGKKLENPGDSFTATYNAPNPDSGYYLPVNFTLEEVLLAPKGVLYKDEASIKVNYATATIDCNLKFVPNKYRIVYDADGIKGNISDAEKEEINRSFALGKIRILLGTQDITDKINDGGAEDYSKLEKAVLSVQPQTYKGMRIRAEHGFSQNKEYLIVFDVRKEKTIAAPIVTINDKYGSRHAGDVEKRTAGGSDNNDYKYQKNVPEKKSLWPLVIAFLAGLVIGGFITYLIFGDKEDAPQQQQTKPQTTLPANNQNISINEEKKLVDEEKKQAQLDAEKKSQEEVAIKAAEEAEKKAAEEAAAEEARKKAEEQRQKDEAKKKISYWLKTGNSVEESKKIAYLDSIKALNNKFKVMTQADMNAIDRILRWKDYNGTRKQKIKKYLKDQTITLENFKVYADSILKIE